MAQLTIKQIARLSGVSTGTVDRILHNRGRVSPEARAADQKVLDTQSYKYNLHTSAVAFKKTKKTLTILISIPSSEKGEYWDLIRRGIDKALHEYSDFDIHSRFVFFDQFNSLSCRQAFDTIAAEDCSAVILGTTFVDETKALCHSLSERHIPYICVDGDVEGTDPVASYKADQQVCGRLMARLMDGLTPPGKELALMLPRRIGTQISNNSAIRLASFKAYFSESGNPRVLHEIQFSTQNLEELHAEVRSFLQRYPDVGGIAVTISNSYLISDALKATGIGGLVVGGFDVTDGNARCIQEGTLDFLINQHPERQGFNAVESMLHYLLYGIPDQSLRQFLPIDIVFRENLPFWQDEQ
jgi:LacI family transcriptional regulator